VQLEVRESAANAKSGENTQATAVNPVRKRPWCERES